MASSVGPVQKPRRNSKIRATSSTAEGSANKGPYKRGVLSDAIVEEARRNGLLGGEKSQHVSFRAPPALLAAAKRETGISSASELGILALAMLAQPDPVVAIMRRTRGRLGKDHKLDT